MGSTNMNTKNVGMNSKNVNSYETMYYAVAAIIIVVIAGLLYYFQDAISTTWNTIVNYFNQGPLATVPHPEPEAEAEPEAKQNVPSEVSHDMSQVVNKVLPSMSSSEVFNVAANRFTYYDAEPLCKAMGAELATYDQVKEAWSKGADWCNYGWVKGQMAVYPTSESTYAKLQGGPEEDRMSCGTTGINGGYFDNPEMRYGVTCYGKKPAQNTHDESAVAKGAPVSPDALAFNQKVSKFKSEADTIAVSPFNGTKWNH